MNDQMKIAALLAAMAEYYGRTMSQAALEMMADDLSDMTYEQVRDAAKAHRRGPKAAFFPAPGDLIGASRGDSEAAAALALSKGREYRLGACDENDAIANRVIVALGGPYACSHMDAGIFVGQFRRLFVALHSGGNGPLLAETRGFLRAGEVHALAGLPGGAQLLELEGATNRRGN